MKRFSAAVLIFLCLLLLPCFATAEGAGDITLIAGLEFGMDRQTAVATSGYQTCTASDKERDILDANGIGTTTYLKGSGSIGGYPATVYVYFNQNDQLVQVVYYFNEGTRTHNSKGDGVTAEKETLFLSEFNAIETSLTSVYGPARASIELKSIYNGWSYSYNRNMTSYVTLTPSVYPYNMYLKDSVTLKGHGKEENYDVLDTTQRIISQSNGCVAIEHTRLNNTQYYMPYNAFNKHFIGYTYYPQDYSTSTPATNNNSVGF